ncbi:hypothetical protein [Mesobacillus maritimus]|uniref:Lipoprotein n=1 Tax=Mesobacillus maritimus TaxID=1643336 RepID=A0ABS7K0K3_9BACI|nr:hypothetical protein [Mesobacillus maritimus]MBY0095686.1 hypothetical protein [Mesobacillus maritimus]
MKKRKIFIVATIFFVLLIGMTACSKPSDETAVIKEGLESDSGSESTIDFSTDSTDKPHNNELSSSDSEDKKEEGKLSQNSTKPDNSSTKNQSKPENITQNADSSQSNGSSAESTSKSDTSEGKQDIVVSSGEKAIQHLKQLLPEGKDDDVSFGVDETLASDDYGSYYTIQLVSISTRVSGKTGTLGYYKVYQDGTYKAF